MQFLNDWLLTILMSMLSMMIAPAINLPRKLTKANNAVQSVEQSLSIALQEVGCLIGEKTGFGSR